jgi:hypothetical protein
MSDQRPASAISSARMRSRKGVTSEARSIVTVSVESPRKTPQPATGMRASAKWWNARADHRPLAETCRKFSLRTLR